MGLGSEPKPVSYTHFARHVYGSLELVVNSSPQDTWRHLVFGKSFADIAFAQPRRAQGVLLRGLRSLYDLGCLNERDPRRFDTKTSRYRALQAQATFYSLFLEELDPQSIELATALPELPNGSLWEQAARQQMKYDMAEVATFERRIYENLAQAQTPQTLGAALRSLLPWPAQLLRELPLPIRQRNYSFIKNAPSSYQSWWIQLRSFDLLYDKLRQQLLEATQRVPAHRDHPEIVMQLLDYHYRTSYAMRGLSQRIFTDDGITSALGFTPLQPSWPGDDSSSIPYGERSFRRWLEMHAEDMDANEVIALLRYGSRLDSAYTYPSDD